MGKNSQKGLSHKVGMNYEWGARRAWVTTHLEPKEPRWFCIHPREGRGGSSLRGRGSLRFIISIVYRALKSPSLHPGTWCGASHWWVLNKSLVIWRMNTGWNEYIFFLPSFSPPWGVLPDCSYHCKNNCDYGWARWLLGICKALTWDPLVPAYPQGLRSPVLAR